MRTFLSIVVCFAQSLSAFASENDDLRSLTPSGLTLVVCDGRNTVLDTLVVPKEMKDGEFQFGMPEKRSEIRVFAIGNRIIGLDQDSSAAKKSNRLLIEELSKSLAGSYFVARPRKNGGIGFVDAHIKQGVLAGMSSGEAPIPFKLTKELRKQIKADLAKDKRAPFVFRLQTDSRGGITRILAK